jgi:DNA (cytosine-5)-methyltransferase 1
MEKIKLLSLFSGIGAFEKALINLKINYELVGFSEINESAIKAYCALYNVDENKNFGDINKIDEKNIPDFNLMSYGFPCQSFSSQGLRKGFCDPKVGNLFFESMRIAKEKKPKWMIAENVKGVIYHDNGNTMKIILKTLNNLGYNNYYKVLNSARYGVAQNRERIFIVSIRKDIDDYTFKFDMGRNPYVFVKDIIDPNIKNEDRKLIKLYKPWINKKYHLHKPNITKSGLSILVDMSKQNYIKAGFKYRNRILSINGLSPTLLTNTPIVFYEIMGEMTGKERLRIQGFTDKDYRKIKFLNEKQLEFITGNSITVNVLEMIFNNLFKCNCKLQYQKLKQALI